MRGPAEHAANIVAGAEQLVDVDAGRDAEAVQHVEHVFGRHIAGRALRIRAAAQTGDGTVERGDAAF
ncbi:hypothetical protein D3C83_112050 [compost metagenome]